MDENTTIETVAIEEIAKVAGGMSKGSKIGIAAAAAALIGTGVTAVIMWRRKLKKDAEAKAAEDLAFRNAKVVDGDFIPESEVK